ncbi:hypothetical protein Emag_006200 [Eimeria magna]
MAAAATPAGALATLARPSARLCCCSCSCSSSSSSSRASLHAQASGTAAAVGEPARSWRAMRETAAATSPAAATAASAAAPAAAANKVREGTAASAAAASAVRLRRAGTLLLNDPPPAYEVSVHRGLKVQASLLLQRLPLVYREPRHEQRFRVYREEWEQQTSNSPMLGDDIVFMQLPGHFLETQQQQQQREQQQRKTGDAELSELDMLLQQQGLKLTTRRRIREQQQQQQQQAVYTLYIRARTLALTSPHNSTWVSSERLLLLLRRQLQQQQQREGEKTSLFLVSLRGPCCCSLNMEVFGNCRWEGDASTRSLKPHSAYPHLIAAPPPPAAAAAAAAADIGSTLHAAAGASRCSLFFYRAYYVPGRPQVSPPLHSPISDWAWLSADEAKTRMAPAAFAAVRDALLLG